MIGTKTKTIDDVEFRTTQLSALRAYPLLIRLVKIAGPALASFQGLDPNTDLNTLGPSLGTALGALDPDEATKLAIDLLASTRAVVDDKVVDLNSESAINKVFTGRLPLMFKVLGFAIQENFAGFLTGGGSAPTAPAAPTAAQS